MRSQVSRLLLLICMAMPAGCRPQAAPRVPAQGYLTGAEGARIYYEVAGSGDDTVVVVHGGPGAGIVDIRPSLEPLARNRVVIFYDQRGGGRSDLPDTTLLTPGHFVGDLEAVREHFGLEQMSLVAQSFGAIVTAEYLRTHPERVARMVFLAPTGPSRQEAAKFYGRTPETSDTAAVRLRSDLMRSLMEGRADDPVAACRELEALDVRLGQMHPRRKGSSCDMPAPALRYYFQYTARLGPQLYGKWDYTRSFRDVTAPLLVVHGERDSLGLAMNRAWARAIPKGRLLVIPDAARAVYADRPEAVFSAIEEFLDGRWPAGVQPRDPP